MKHNFLFLITIAFCATACATVHSWPPAVYQTPEKSKPLTNTEAKILYQQYYVAKTDGMLSQIDYEYYSGRATAKYFEKSGAVEAADMANEAIALEHSGKKWELGCLIGGAVIGVLGGGIYGYSITPSDASPYVGGIPTMVCAVLGGLGGVILGGTTGWSLYHAHYHPKAEEIFSEAGDSFNQDLAGKLNISISPTSGGAAGAIKFTY